MSFDVDAILGPPAPAQPPRAPTSAAEQGASFDEHLADAAPDEEPAADARKPADVKTESTDTPIIAQAPPTPTEPPAPMVIQLIASATSQAPVIAATTEEVAPATPVVAPNTRPAPAVAAAVVAPVVKAATPNTKKSGETRATEPETVETTPEIVTEAGKPAATKRAAPVEAAPQVEATAPAQTDAPTPNAQPQTLTPEIVAAAPLVAPVAEKSAAPQAKPIDTDAGPQPTDAPSPNTDARTTKATPQQADGAKAASPAGKAPDAFAAALAAAQNAAPEQTSASAPSSALSAASATNSATAIPAHDAAARTAPVAAQVGREIIRRFAGENTRIEVRLDPPELGRVEVRLEVSRDHRVTGMVTADNPQALADLTRHARELEQALQSAGLELSDNGLSFDLQQHGASERDAKAANGGAAHIEDAEVAPAATLAARPLGFEHWRGVRVDVMA